MASGVWIFAEQKNGQALEASLEVISEGRRLADQLNQELTVLVLGREAGRAAGTFGAYGPDRVLWAEADEWGNDQPEAFAALLSALAREEHPCAFLFAATSLGDELASRIAALLRTALSPRCDKLQLSPEGELHCTRLVYDNKVHLTESLGTSHPWLVTVLPGVMKIRKVQRTAPSVHRIDHTRYLRDAPATRVLGLIKPDPRTIDISEAEMIVAGGKGVEGEAGFRLLSRMADLLGASVAGSRMAVDAGCIGKEAQIGQSGKSVSPELLISCGISGANAHTVGMRDARVVIAINKDKGAPMMKLADLGVVGDFHAIAAALVARLQAGGGVGGKPDAALISRGDP